jgi:hypothetical protein
MVRVVFNERVYHEGENYLKDEEYQISQELVDVLGDSVTMIGERGSKSKDIKKARNAAMTSDETETKEEETSEEE